MITLRTSALLAYLLLSAKELIVEIPRYDQTSQRDPKRQRMYLRFISKYLRGLSLFFLLGVTLFLAGCGYTLGEIKPTTMRRVNSISVGTLKNDTLIPRLESQTADAIAKQFQQDGTYRLETPDRADANLMGTIVSVKRQPMRVYASNVMQTSEFDLILTIEFVVKDRLTGVILLRGRAEGHVPFFINSDNINSDLVTDQNINYPIAAQRAAELIVSRVSEGW